MGKIEIELIIFSILTAIWGLVAFDFIVYVLKPAPARSYFSKRMWNLGFLIAIVLIYWFMNGMQF